jgi:thymidylate kinase
MRIILEGVDGIGKSTICKKLSEKFGMSIIHNRADTDNSVEYYAQLLTVPNLIQDRSYVSEEVYSMAFGRKIRLDHNDLAFIKARAASHSTVVIILYSSDPDGSWRLNNTNETKELQEHQNMINKLYWNYAKMNSDCDNVIGIDVARFSNYAERTEEITSMVSRIAKALDEEKVKADESL